ncbi:MAG: hypothetical protein PHE02_06465 [Lachnospiraceae bacterium]|nr:hypothetical protein [Lachnospiraceae bacterium]
MKFFPIVIVLLGITLYGCALSDNRELNCAETEQSQTIRYESETLQDNSSEIKVHYIDFRKRERIETFIAKMSEKSEKDYTWIIYKMAWFTDAKETE